jgi:prepilin-type N-terminal cleavage/methylation domain-containing protein
VPQRLARLRAARQNEGGFTLIELLIVIVILGVLAGVVVFSVRFVNDRGEKAACKTDVKTVQAAVEGYYAQNTNYPGALTDLVPNYLASVPKPDQNKYTIAYDSTTHQVTGTFKGADCTSS